MLPASEFSQMKAWVICGVEKFLRGDWIRSEERTPVKGRVKSERFDGCRSNTMFDLALSRAESTERDAKKTEAESFSI